MQTSKFYMIFLCPSFLLPMGCGYMQDKEDPSDVTKSIAKSGLSTNSFSELSTNMLAYFVFDPLEK